LVIFEISHLALNAYIKIERFGKGWYRVREGDGILVR